MTALELRGELARGRSFARRTIRLLRATALVAASGVLLGIAFLAAGIAAAAAAAGAGALVAVLGAMAELYALGRWREREAELLREQRHIGGRA